MINLILKSVRLINHISDQWEYVFQNSVLTRDQVLIKGINHLSLKENLIRHPVMINERPYL